MDLSIIIVSFNTKELLKKCLESIYNLQFKIYNYEVIVIDNGSEDGSREYLEMFKCSNVQMFKAILNKENLGFAKANNQGIKMAKGEYILLLNSDTEVKPGALGKLVEFAKNHPRAGVIGAKLLNPDGSVQPSIYNLPTIGRAIKEYWLGRRGTYEKYIPVEKSPAEVEAVTGAAMLVPKEVLNKVGLLDERYFFYFEDLDFCQRLKKAGFLAYYLPSAEVIHHHGASGKEIPGETQEWLEQSSKIYHGTLRYYLITFVIWTSQKWQKLLGKIKA